MHFNQLILACAALSGTAWAAHSYGDHIAERSIHPFSQNAGLLKRQAAGSDDGGESDTSFFPPECAADCKAYQDTVDRCAIKSVSAKDIKDVDGADDELACACTADFLSGIPGCMKCAARAFQDSSRSNPPEHFVQMAAARCKAAGHEVKGFETADTSSSESSSSPSPSEKDSASQSSIAATTSRTGAASAFTVQYGVAAVLASATVGVLYFL